MSWFSQEVVENLVATVIDFVSIIFAYNLGVLQLGAAVGIAYAAFDAYIVIWMRRRITGWVRRVLDFVNPTGVPVTAESREGGLK